MTRIRSRSLSRRGFTLIELLVVIAIIAILVSLTAAGVMKVLGRIPEIQTRTEISQFDVSLASFMSDYSLSDPPPSKLILCENLNQYGAGDPNLAFLKRVFGKNIGGWNGTSYTVPIDWNGDGALNGPLTLEGEQCLVFYTGGIPSVASGTPQCLGFSTNNINPAMAGGKRNGPYMTFKTSRLVPGTLINPSLSSFFVYIDAWNVTAGPLPYAYFSSSGINNGYTITDCQTIGALPYWTATNPNGTPTGFTNSNKYQIISAGQPYKQPSGQVLSTFGGGLWVPSSGAAGTGRYNQANFSSTVLLAGQN